MKAALEAWGADSNLFHQGAAKESTDPDVVAATMAKPGVVLKRPVFEFLDIIPRLTDPARFWRRPKGRFHRHRTVAARIWAFL
jgi:hypothetical protein